MKTKRMILAALLALGMAAPAGAQVVDYGDGIKWDFGALQRAKPATGPVDKAYHETSEPGKHIPPEAPRPVYGPGEKPAEPGHELSPRMHQSQ